MNSVNTFAYMVGFSGENNKKFPDINIPKWVSNLIVMNYLLLYKYIITLHFITKTENRETQ